MRPDGRFWSVLASLAVTAATFGFSAVAQDNDTAQKSLEGREAEIKYTMEIEGNNHGRRRCKANISLAYLQKNQIASVESTLVNEECAASSGSYVVSVRTKNDAGESQTKEYEESWQRSDNETIELTREYVIDENVDLIAVRAKRLRCLCAEPLLKSSDQ